MPERFRKILRVTAICLSPVTLLVLLNIINPLAVSFLAKFNVVNETGRDILVTPIGAVGSKGQRRPLPLSENKIISLGSARKINIPIPKGQTREFAYDWDDIQFSELLITAENGDFHVLITDPEPLKNQYHQPLKESFTIPPLSELPEAPENLTAVVENAGQNTKWLYPTLYTLAIIPILLGLVLRFTEK